MDLSKLNLEAASEEGVVCEIRHPITDDVLHDSEGKPVTIRVLGSQSKKYKSVIKKKRAKFKNDRSLMANADKIELALLETYAECTVEWHGVEWEGKPLECNPKNALMLYSKGGFEWLSEQIQKHIRDTSKIPLAQ